MSAPKVRLATSSLAGCFGCHMSFLDLDERFLQLVEHVDLDRTPLTDVKHIRGTVDVGLVEGGVCNAENVHVLREFRERCRILVAVGECAVTGGVPALRNPLPLRELFAEAYLRSGVVNPQIPSDPELPLLLSQVHPIRDVVTIDFSLPGCPPSANVIWAFLTELLAGRDPTPRPGTFRYD